MPNPSDPYADFVEHPRYGRKPHFTWLNLHENCGAEIFLHWHSPKECRIPKTAIAANTSLQLNATVPITHYFDLVRTCRNCSRRYIFFAKEQKFWYENLQFPLEADCVRCIDCRKRQRETCYLRDRYEELVIQKVRSKDETLELIDCAVTLLERKVFGNKVIERIRSWFNSFPSDSKIRKHKTFQTLFKRLEVICENLRQWS